MAVIKINSPDMIEFVNHGEDKNAKDAPALLVQAGEWQDGPRTETGIVFETFGDEAPILTAANARKLSHWLQRAANMIEGVKTTNKKRGYDTSADDDDFEDFNRFR